MHCVYIEKDNVHCLNKIDICAFCIYHFEQLYSIPESTVTETALFCRNSVILVPSLVKIVQLYDDRMRESITQLSIYYLKGFKEYVSNLITTNEQIYHDQIYLVNEFFEFLSTNAYYSKFVKDDLDGNRGWMKFNSTMLDRAKYFHDHFKKSVFSTHDTQHTLVNCIAIFESLDIEKLMIDKNNDDILQIVQK